jgi:hypothetical protein
LNVGREKVLRVGSCRSSRLLPAAARPSEPTPWARERRPMAGGKHALPNRRRSRSFICLLRPLMSARPRRALRPPIRPGQEGYAERRGLTLPLRQVEVNLSTSTAMEPSVSISPALAHPAPATLPVKRRRRQKPRVDADGSLNRAARNKQQHLTFVEEAGKELKQIKRRVLSSRRAEYEHLTENRYISPKVEQISKLMGSLLFDHPAL